jgi:Resolvase, N terminal domain
MTKARKATAAGNKRQRGPRSIAGAKRVAFYQRVSTGGQTTANQRRELQAVAKRHGWNVVHVFEDNGISGAKDRDQRPGLDALLKAVARREIDMVAAWSVDRLGRALKNLVEVLGELHAKGVDLYLHQQRARHVHAKRAGDVSDDGRVCRIRARHDPRARARRDRTGQGGRRHTGAPVDRGQQRRQIRSHQSGAGGEARRSADRPRSPDRRRHGVADQGGTGGVI